MADEVHPVPVVVLPADVPEAPPSVVKCKTRSAECGVWKMRSVENAEC